MKTIQLHPSGTAIVDDDDFELANSYRWNLSAYGYASNTGKSLFLHRLIMNTPAGMSTHHKNGDKMDNRKENLVVCTVQENLMGKPLYKNNTSGYKGVVRAPRGRWRALLSLSGKKKHIGQYETAEEAARAYDRAAKESYGDFAVLNFP